MMTCSRTLAVCHQNPIERHHGADPGLTGGVFAYRGAEGTLGPPSAL